MSTPATNPTGYAKLLAEIQPQPIHSEGDYDHTVEKIGELMGRGEENLSPEETSLVEMMSILIEQYEREHYPLQPSKPSEMIKFLMDQQGLQQRDLAEVLDSKSHLSEILSGKRNPSKAQAKRLGELFKVSPALFI